MQRCLIFGAGAVGTLLGGVLAHSGYPVTFVGRRWNTEAIHQRGISISGLWGDYQVAPQPAYETVAEIPGDQQNFDWVWITTKAYATDDAIQNVAPIIQHHTKVISCQNGYGNCQTIASYIGWKNTLGARLITGVEMPQPAQINVTVHGDDMRLGHYVHATPMEELEALTQTLRNAHIPVQATEQLEQYLWAKILYNAALNPLGALLNVRYGELAEQSDTRRVMETVIDEAFQVTNAHGIKHFWPAAKDYQHAFYTNMVPPTAAHYPSMLRDLEKGRRTEINALNGAICQLGRSKNVQTTVNDTITSLIHFHETRVQNG